MGTLVRITRDINDINVKPNESDVYVETFIALLDSMNNEFGKFSIGSILKKPITTRHLEDYLQKDYTKMEKEEKSPIVDTTAYEPMSLPLPRFAAQVMSATSPKGGPASAASQM